MTPPTVRFRDWNCIVRKGRYDNGRPALQLIDAEDGSPIAKVTVNLPDAPLGPNQVAVKSYSENAGLLESLTEAGIVKPTGEAVRCGHATAAVCELLPPLREAGHAERLGESKGRGRGR